MDPEAEAIVDHDAGKMRILRGEVASGSSPPNGIAVMYAEVLDRIIQTHGRRIGQDVLDFTAVKGQSN